MKYFLVVFSGGECDAMDVKDDKHHKKDKGKEKKKPPSALKKDQKKGEQYRRDTY
jgi:hypothetical protein